MKIAGALIVVAGIGLFIGNVTGTFPTFSGAGWLTIFVGSTLYSKG